jgi:flagellar motor switch protein FliM
MSLLNDDAVAALVEAAREGNLPEGQYLAAPKKRPPTIRVVDFRRTVKFKSEHQDRLKRAVEMFCRTATSRLTSELRSAVELEPGHAEQGMWSRAHADVRRTATCLVIAPGELAPPIVLAAEQSLVLDAVDRLLGGDSSVPVVTRPLTEVDRMVARRLFNTITHCLTSAWKELCGEDLALQRVMTYEQAADVCAVEEPTLVLSIDVKLERGKSGLQLLIPYNAISALLARLHHGTTQDPAAHAALNQTLSDVGLELRAQVGGLDMTVDDVLALAPGDVVALHAPAADGVTLYADGVPLQAARPGRNGGRRAVQLDSRVRGDA